MRIAAFCFGMVLGSLIIGGFLGWLAGIVWYEFVEVPKAASMDPMTAASYLCAAGRYEPLLMAALGVVAGAFVGTLASALKATR
ncbi:MAG: hypothetical protein AB7U82_26425 [Blastocatellales bacterium]